MNITNALGLAVTPVDEKLKRMSLEKRENTRGKKTTARTDLRSEKLMMRSG